MLTKIQNPRINYLSRILALPILAITVLAFTLRTKSVHVATINLEKPITVVIDAGHGLMENGKPNGVLADGISEDDIVLDIANKIKDLNTNGKLNIVLTRSSDKIVDLHKRVDIAKENKADLFISIHVNAASADENPDLHPSQSLNKGFEIYVSGKQPVYQKQSELFGSVLQQELSSVYSTNPYLLKRKVGVWVLDQNVCPSVLVECGFLTDDKDRKFITEDDNQTAVATKILEAIGRYALNQQESQKINSDPMSMAGEINSTESSHLSQETTRKLDLKNPPLYIFDGKEISKEEVDKIAPSTIESVNVLKGKSAVDKYGSKGVNGVVEIKSKFQKQPLFIVDGKEVTKPELDKINPSLIESINVLKGDTATSRYGEKGKDGVVEIKLKNQSSDANFSFLRNGKTLEKRQLTRDPSTNKIDEISMHAQVTDTVPKKEALFTKVEVEAAANKEEWTKFLQEHLQSSIEQATAKGMKPGTYTINVKFIVMTDGSVSNVKALNDPGFELAEAAVKAVRTGPKWKPGLQHGKPVNSYHTQPITFVIQER